MKNNLSFSLRIVINRVIHIIHRKKLTISTIFKNPAGCQMALFYFALTI